MPSLTQTHSSPLALEILLIAKGNEVTAREIIDLISKEVDIKEGTISTAISRLVTKELLEPIRAAQVTGSCRTHMLYKTTNEGIQFLDLYKRIFYRHNDVIHAED